MQREVRSQIVNRDGIESCGCRERVEFTDSYQRVEVPAVSELFQGTGCPEVLGLAPEIVANNK